jgi:hypothetical protein
MLVKFMKDASTQRANNCILFSMKLKQTTLPYGKTMAIVPQSRGRVSWALLDMGGGYKITNKYISQHAGYQLFSP